MSENKIIFIDVDGTLCNDSGVVPASAKKAIIEARQNGHLIYLCTGRSKAEMDEAILGIGFDGFIGAGGGYVESKGTVISHKLFKKAELLELIAFLNEHQIEHYLESNTGLFATSRCKEKIEEIVFSLLTEGTAEYLATKKAISHFFSMISDDHALLDYGNVNKVSFINNRVPIQVVQDAFGERFNIMPSTVAIFGENSGEVAIKGVHKAAAIELLIKHLGLSDFATMAYGDGLDDKEMLEYVDIGIAMGNASELLKTIADEVTLTHNEDGIYHSFKKYNLI